LSALRRCWAEARAVADLLRAHSGGLGASRHAVSDSDALSGAAWALRPQIAAEVDDMAMMRLIVREGHALGVLPPIAVRDELADGVLAEAEALPGVRRERPRRHHPPPRSPDRWSAS
jgi:LysR family transcriptional activator of nhaA